MDSTPLQKLALLSDDNDTISLAPPSERAFPSSLSTGDRIPRDLSVGRFTTSSALSRTFSNRTPLAEIPFAAFRSPNVRSIDVKEPPSISDLGTNGADPMPDTDDEVEIEYQKLLAEARRSRLPSLTKNTNGPLNGGDSVQRRTPPPPITQTSVVSHSASVKSQKSISVTNVSRTSQEQIVQSESLFAYRKRFGVWTPSTDMVHGLSYYGVYSQTLLGSWECGKCKKNSIGNFCHHCGSRCVMLQLLLDDEGEATCITSASSTKIVQSFCEEDVLEAQELLELPNTSTIFGNLVS